jgi:hypothetical protein
MFETYRMLGEQREAELLREAQRLHAGQAVKDDRLPRTPRRRLVSVFHSSTVGLLIRLRGPARAAEKPPRSQLDP